MSQEIECRLVPDPQGHGDALLLKGDWLLVHIRDGKEIGRGEASHSGNDQLCMQRIQDLFERFVKGTTLSLENIKRLEQEALSQVSDFVSATAFSGINQALYELLAVKEGVPVWQLLRKDLACSQIPVYATINRALTTRTGEDYLSVIHRVRQSGLQAIKCAPFEAVEQGGDQVTCSHDGLHVL